MKTIEEKLAEIKAAFPPDWIFEGGTVKALERFQEAQQVSCLPEMYRQFFLLTGFEGIEKILGWGGNSNPRSECLIRKKALNDAARYPRDLFIFFERQGWVYYFFRTKNCLEDPAVFLDLDDDWFYKRGDSLSEFILSRLRFPPESPEYRELEKSQMKRVYYYHPEKDDFYDAPNPEPYD